MKLDQTIMKLPPEEELDDSLAIPRGYLSAFGKHVPVYPKGDYSTGWQVLSALGSFWSRHFGDRGELLALYRGEAALAVQSYIDYLEAVACVSKEECPIFHRRTWYALTILESELSSGKAALLRYGDARGAGYGESYAYGTPVTDDLLVVDLGEIKHVGLLTNRILDPSLTWVNGTDYYLEDGALALRANPFTDGRLPVQNILDSAGKVTDRQVVLWGFDTQQDHEYLYQHYGFVLRYKASSSQGYKDLINAVWNGFVGGLSTRDLEWMLAALAGIPAVKESQEVVEAILPYAYKTVVVTDRHSYIYPQGSVARVTVGEQVYVGQALVDTVSVFDLANFDDCVDLLTRPFVNDTGRVVTRYTFADSSSSEGAVQAVTQYLGHRSPSKVIPDADTAPLLVLLPIGKGFLGTGYQGPLGFMNERGAYDTSSMDAAGRIIGKVAPVRGTDADLDSFWNAAHSAGVAEGETWLQKLKPLPTYVNPAGFVIEHFLQNHGLVVYLRYTRFDEDAQNLGLLRLLRDTLPPEKTVIFLLDVEQEDDGSLGAEEHKNCYAAVTSECSVGHELLSSSSAETCMGGTRMTDDPQSYYVSRCG